MAVALVTVSYVPVFAQVSTPAPSPSPCAARNHRPLPTDLPTLPPNLPKITDADIQAAIEAGEEAARNLKLPTPPPNLPTAPPGFVPCSGPGDLQSRIYNAAMAFVDTVTCNLHGAAPGEECMASVNQILQNAGIAPIGPGPNGTNYIPTAVLNYPNRLVEIPQSATVPGDLMVRHSPGDSYTSSGGFEHVTVCIVRGCVRTVSNSSSAGDPACPGVFDWFSDDTLCYPGSPYCGAGSYSQFYRVVS